MIKVIVNSKLKEYCRSRKISLRELSKMTGLSAAALYKRGNPTLETIAVLLTALNCKFEDIFKIDEL